MKLNMNIKVHKDFVRTAVYLCKLAVEHHNFRDELIECNLREASDELIREYARHYMQMCKLVIASLGREFLSNPEEDEALVLLQRIERLMRGYRAGNVPKKP
jgi:hypothetical protein